MNLRKSISLLLFLCGVGCLQPALLYAQLPDVIWEQSGATDSACFGVSVFPLGDQNDDGFADWGVSAPTWRTAYDSDPTNSYVELYFGGDPPNSQAWMRFTPWNLNVYWVISGRSCGDLNDDGYDELYILVNPNEDLENRWTYLYIGGPGLSLEFDFMMPTPIGTGYRGMGDFNGDGYDDLFNLNVPDGGGQILYGSAEFDTIPDWVIHDDPPGSSSSFPVGFGDVNGDGFADFLSAYQDEGIRIYLGGVQPDTIPGITLPVVPPLGAKYLVEDLNEDNCDELIISDEGIIDVYLGGSTMSGVPNYTLNFGNSCHVTEIVSAGDFNGDWHNDMLAIDDFTCQASWGYAALYLGYRWLNPDPVFGITGMGTFDLYGINGAAGLGDVNNDGYDDVIISSFLAQAGYTEGRCVILAGDSSYVVSVDNTRPEMPVEIDISIYPNPFNAETTIELNLPMSSGQLELRIYNTLGQQVHETFIPAWASNIKYRWNGSANGVPLPTGVYFVHVNTSTAHATKKLLVLK